MNDEIRWVKTHCARMDHGVCALKLRVKSNKIETVKGDPAGYLNKGYICSKGIASPDRLTHPLRLKHPMKRTGFRGEGKWQKISWNEAIALVSEKMQLVKDRLGARSVAFCQGMPKGLEHFVLIRLANIFGSPNVVVVQDVCHAPREISGLHTCGFYPVADFHHKNNLVLLWGSNPTSTNEEGQICSLLLNRIKEGTELMVVDPRRTELAAQAKYWLQIRPGTDSALALAFLNVIITEGLFDEYFVKNWTYGFDELSAHVESFSPEKMSQIVWISPDLIRESARAYARSHPAAIAWGNPIEQTKHAFNSARALICLMAVCGNLDVPGGNIQANEPGILSLGKFVRADKIPSKPKDMIHAHHHTIPKMMTVPPAYFKKAVLEGRPYPVKAAYIQCANPLLAYADSQQTYDALMSLDFLAVSDIFMTPTAALADVVLPAATHFEFNDIGHYGLGHGFILARPKVVNPPGQCWPDIRILNELGKSMTPGKYWHDNWEDLLNDLTSPAGLSYSQFVEKGCLKGEDTFRKYEAGGFKTPTGKVELALSKAAQFKVPELPAFDEYPEPENSQFPLVLTSAKSRYYLHSSYRWLEKLRKKQPHPQAWIHPQTAAAYGINENDDIIIETPSGQINQVAHLTDTVHPRVIYAAYGWWYPEEKAGLYGWNRSNFNMLTSTEQLGRQFGTPNLKGINCRIRRG